MGEWLENIPRPYTEDDASTFLAASARGLTEGTGANLAVVLDGRVAGAVGLRFGAEDRAVAEVGYWTAAPARGRRITTRAVVALCGWAFETAGVRRVELYAAVGNDASRGVATAAGFSLEGVLGAWRRLRGQPSDFALYTLFPSE